MRSLLYGLGGCVDWAVRLKVERRSEPIPANFDRPGPNNPEALETAESMPKRLPGLTVAIESDELRSLRHGRERTVWNHPARDI